MLENKIHIISFDVPYPANYGGVVDVFYKIKSLHELGIKVILHCFKYGREEQEELEKYCEQVYYYERKVAKRFLFNTLPYITKTRRSEKLLENLMEDRYPIIFEGLHCCAYLDDPILRGRKKLVRMHNIEHDYYSNLAENERNVFRKYYFFNEANKLKKFESVLESASDILAISNSDYEYLHDLFPNVVKISAFHPNDRVRIKSGKGNFAFYHGNLSVGENDIAAQFLVNEVFNDIDIPLVIAGSKPSEELKSAVNENSNCTLKVNLDTEAIHQLIIDAQMNVLPTFQVTGIKLKLLMALYNGRHCIVNTPMVTNTGLEDLCTVCEDTIALKQQVISLFDLEIGEEVTKREEVLDLGFSNRVNAEKLIHLLS
ncbi:MAG: hypothetical protein HRT72_10890 [Flavobacteriales bacterium]|nr:hypothetical protein [Flavobacteriales bacterium]